MKRWKKPLLALMLIGTAAGVCGCAKQESAQERMHSMQSYAAEKYETDFAVEDFQAAKDETYTDILTLSDGEHRFHVYQDPGGEPSDDYPQVVINTKICSWLQSQCGTDFELYGNFILADAADLTLDEAMHKDTAAFLKQHDFMKAIVIVKTEQDIAALSQELYRVYQETIGLTPQYIDFEVIQAGRIGAELEKMLLNLPALYDSEWSRHPEIEAYIRVTQTDISSAAELMEKGGSEKRTGGTG